MNERGTHWYGKQVGIFRRPSFTFDDEDLTSFMTLLEKDLKQTSRMI